MKMPSKSPDINCFTGEKLDLIEVFIIFHFCFLFYICSSKNVATFGSETRVDNKVNEGIAQYLHKNLKHKWCLAGQLVLSLGTLLRDASLCLLRAVLVSHSQTARCCGVVPISLNLQLLGQLDRTENCFI